MVIINCDYLLFFYYFNRNQKKEKRKWLLIGKKCSPFDAIYMKVDASSVTLRNDSVFLLKQMSEGFSSRPHKSISLNSIGLLKPRIRKKN